MPIYSPLVSVHKSPPSTANNTKLWWAWMPLQKRKMMMPPRHWFKKTKMSSPYFRRARYRQQRTRSLANMLLGLLLLLFWLGSHIRFNNRALGTCMAIEVLELKLTTHITKWDWFSHKWPRITVCYRGQLSVFLMPLQESSWGSL